MSAALKLYWVVFGAMPSPGHPMHEPVKSGDAHGIVGYALHAVSPEDAIDRATRIAEACYIDVMPLPGYPFALEGERALALFPALANHFEAARTYGLSYVFGAD